MSKMLKSLWKHWSSVCYEVQMPQPTPKLLPSIENIAEGCTSSETSPSFTGFLLLPKKGQHASIMSTESFKTCLPVSLSRKLA
uniref:Uncharacterized protein n=1 Tax=Quercus lobata TaxID=97700 RepID=A0A7N2MEV2_QUELO